MTDVIAFAGNVDWSGENPGISLKETADGPFVALASFFRVVLSPHGRGHVLVLLQSPQESAPPAPRVKLGGTLFERMSSVSRGAAREDDPTDKDPLDIPRFLHRQNNQ